MFKRPYMATVRRSRSISQKLMRRKHRDISDEEESKEPKMVDQIDMVMDGARYANDDVIMKAYLKHFDFTRVDDDGNTALHIAAMHGHVYICRMLIVLVSPVRLWEIKNYAGLTAEDLATDERVIEDLKLLRQGQPRVEDEFTRWNDNLINSTKRWKENGKLLLALDGGGVKALVIVQMLLYLEKQLREELVSRIDWVAGTSSGGIVALMLCQGKGLSATKRFLLENRFRVFCGNKVKVPKHDASGVENVARTLFGDGNMASFPKNSPRVMVTVADTRKSPANIVLFRSFSPRLPDSLREQLDYLNPEKILIWKAARCTCAAPFYFNSYNGLSDGGLVANNPTEVLIADFLQTTRLETAYSTKEYGPHPSIGCVVSMGTCLRTVESTNGIDFNFNIISTKKNPLRVARGFVTVMNNAKKMIQLLVRECTSCNGLTVRHSREWCHSLNVPFFRFSPPLQQAVQLDATDTDVLVQMLWEAECFIHGPGKYELNQLAEFLALKPTTADIRSRTTNITYGVENETMERGGAQFATD